MRLRNCAALVVPLLFVACGGHSRTPTAPASALLDFVPGAYTLTVTMSPSGDPKCDNGFCSSIGLCIGVAGPLAPVTPMTTVVDVERQGDTVTVRPEDSSASLRMELKILGTALSGRVSGEFRDGSAQLSVVGREGQSAAAVIGTLLTGSVVGKIDGQVGIGGYSCSNNGHTWTLAPR